MIEHEAFRQAMGDALGIVGFLVVVGGAGISMAMAVALFAGNASVSQVESGLTAGLAWLAAGGALLLIGRRLGR